MQTPSSQTTRPPLPPLPDVVWRRIVYHLSDSLPTLLLLSKLRPDLRDICRRHTSSHFHTIHEPVPPLPAASYYHSILQLVLEGHLDPASIYEFYRHDGVRAKLDPSVAQQVCIRDALFCDAVRASPFIPADLASMVCARFRDGDTDAVLVVLLPLCIRLKTLEIVRQSELCAAMFQIVTQEHQRQGTKPEEARQRANEAALRDRRGGPWRKGVSNSSSKTLLLPFSELLVLYVGCTNPFAHSYDLVDMVPFMGIPSLHRIVLTAVRDIEFPGWPTSDARCSCPQIYFQEASVSRQAVLAFAQGLDGPCEIRQWFERPREDGGNEPSELTWDRVLIKRRPDGGKDIETRLEFEGGNPGYDHAWVSWLYHQKMQDWKRLDEEFRIEEGDREDCWLSGGLG